jgi:hypothetical protein
MKIKLPTKSSLSSNIIVLVLYKVPRYIYFYVTPENNYHQPIGSLASFTQMNIFCFIFQAGLGILLFVTISDTLFAICLHSLDMKMYAVDYSTGMIKFITFVSQIKY